jgi:hypothetical protein
MSRKSSTARAVDAPCAMASLVEAGHDGRLGDREEASLARHLAACAACRALARDLDEVRLLLRRPGPPVTQLEHQRGRLALLRAAATPPPPKTRGRARAAGLAISLASAAVSVLALVGPRPAPVSVAQHLPHVSLHLPPAEPSAQRVYPPETTVHASSTARFERRTVDQVERVALREGVLDVAVRKLGLAERFLVATDDAEVEVRGTVFQIEAHAGHVVRVTVSEGLVEVRYGNAISLVPAGGEWQPPKPPAEPSTLASTAPRRVAAAPFKPAARPAATSDGEASRSFGDAVDLLGRGDYAAARARLDAFRADHPSDDRADLAAFLTIVSLQRAGRRAEARDAARRYLELYPGGDRRADATRVAFER